MSKKAFLVGVNTFGLQFAEKDIELMSQCLTKYGYEIVKPDKKEKYSILKQFEEMLNKCKRTDTIIFYYSGHGDIPKGKLHLVLGADSSKEVSNKLRITGISELLENCCATNKLIILDCCHAGAAHADLHIDLPDAYRILTASERLEKSKELDEFQASFLTYQIHQTLTQPPSEICVDNSIRISAFYQWLVKSAKQHNLNHSAQVPIPNLLGNEKANFEIATCESKASADESPRLLAVTSQSHNEINSEKQKLEQIYQNVDIPELLPYYLSVQERQDPKKVIFFLPYLIDQDKQEDMFLEAVKNHRFQQNEEQRKQPLLCLIYGNERCNDHETIRLLLEKRLLKRLEKDLEKDSYIDIDYKKNSDLGGRLFYLGCGTPDDADDLHRTMKRNLANTPMVNELSALKDKIVTNIANQSKPTIFHSRLVVEELPSGKEIEIIKGFINFWTNWHSQEHLLLVFLIVVYKNNNEKTKEKTTFFQHLLGKLLKGKSIAEKIDDILSSKFSVKVIKLPELEINSADIRDWYSGYCLRYMRNFCPPETIYEEMHTILESNDDNLLTYQCGIRMSELVDKLKNALNNLYENI